MDIAELRRTGRILMEGVVGSQLYGLATESSDTDIRGIFMPTVSDMLDLTGEKNTEIADERQDSKFYSLKKFMKLAGECNPNIIELLYLPDDKLLQTSRCYRELVAHRDRFISKRASATFRGYAYAQLQRAKSLGKKGNEIPDRVNESGIRKLRGYLAMHDEMAGISDSCRHVSEEYVKMLEHMLGKNFVAYLRKEKGDAADCPSNLSADPDFQCMLPPNVCQYVLRFGPDASGMPFRPRPMTRNDLVSYKVAKVEGQPNLYRLYFGGNDDEAVPFVSDDGTQVICSPIRMDEERDLFAGVVSIDLEKYRRDQAAYDSFWEWMANRNEKRYTADWRQDTLVDNKNMMHVMRLMLSARSIALTGEPRVVFDGPDRDWLMKIRRGEIPYDELVKEADLLMQETSELFDRSGLPEHADYELLNEWFCRMALDYWQEHTEA